MTETQDFQFTKKTKFSDCNTCYYQFAYIITCCNFDYMCPCDTDGYFYWCGKDMDKECPQSFKSCYYSPICCCFPCCVSLCCELCRTNVFGVK